MMQELILQDIYIYPVKSLGGLSVPEAEVQQKGLQYDRRWMLTDKKGNFLSQRTNPQMALLQVNINENGLIISHKKHVRPPIAIPFDATTKKEVTVSIWNDVCKVLEVSVQANEWFSLALNMTVKLVFMPDLTNRFVETNYADIKRTVSFADAYPFLVISQSSLDQLNNCLQTPIPMNRFRPNLVFTGGAPHVEDTFHAFRIGNISFTTAKPCVRCVLTTIDQESATRGKEPLKTLSGYRTSNNQILFGQNLLHTGSGIIKTGDKIIVQQLKEE